MEEQPEPRITEEKKPVMIAKGIGVVVMLVVAIALVIYAYSSVNFTMRERAIYDDYVVNKQFDKAYTAYLELSKEVTGSRKADLENQAAVAAVNHVASQNAPLPEMALWYHRAYQLDPSVLDESAMQFVKMHQSRLDRGVVDPDTGKLLAPDEKADESEQ